MQNVKNLRKVKIIIRCQVTTDLDIKTLKINQSVFIYEFFESENMIDCNFVNISIKTKYIIDIQEPRNYKKVEIKPYQ